MRVLQVELVGYNTVQRLFVWLKNIYLKTFLPILEEPQELMILIPGLITLLAAHSLM